MEAARGPPRPAGVEESKRATRAQGALAIRLKGAGECKRGAIRSTSHVTIRCISARHGAGRAGRADVLDVPEIRADLLAWPTGGAGAGDACFAPMIFAPAWDSTVTWPRVFSDPG